MPVKLRKQLTKTTGKPRLTGLPIKNYLTTVGGSESGATVAVTLVVVLAVIAGTAVVAQRSFDGLIGSRFQGRAKDARLTAEAGTAYIISEWNRPANRRLYTGLPMANWGTAKNRCTADPPNFDIGDALNPTPAATIFSNGAEVSLPGNDDGTTRKFKLISATFTPGSSLMRGSSFKVSDSSPEGTGASPAISESSPRGYLQLEVEGKIYRTGDPNPLATSTVTREFIIEPKCCNRSFGSINQNLPELGNDFRICAGQSNLPIGDLAVITGLGGGGGLTKNSDSNALRIIDANNNKLNSTTCTRPEGSTEGTCDFRENALRTRNGDIEYEIKPLTIPSPPSILEKRGSLCGTAPNCLDQSLAIQTGDMINTRDSSSINGRHCQLGRIPGELVDAYHCIVSSISLTGNGNTLTVDTANYPVYLYLQENANNVTVGGQASIIHSFNGSPASLAQSNRLQIRGITKPSNSACSSTQTFDLFGNASTAMFIWAPCANTNMRGSTEFGGIIWTNNLDFSGGGTGSIKLAIPSNPGVCTPGSQEVPCRVLEDAGESIQRSAPIDWAARSINFTRFF
jgi:hypothetical protein